MPNSYEYYFLPKAEKDLNEIVKYIEQVLFNTKAADDFAYELFDKIDAVRKFPLSGQLIDNIHISDSELRKIVVGNYLVFYKPIEKIKTIVIVRIVYGSRNLDEILSIF